ncbi:MAG: hypothetical protein ACW96X_01165 [Promethearchaeota archaeon]
MNAKMNAKMIKIYQVFMAVVGLGSLVALGLVLLLLFGIFM